MCDDFFLVTLEFNAIRRLDSGIELAVGAHEVGEERFVVRIVHVRQSGAPPPGGVMRASRTAWAQRSIVARWVSVGSGHTKMLYTMPPE